MKTFFEILQYIPFVLIGFILFAIVIRIIAKISIKTWFEEKFKNEKEKNDAKNYSRTKKSRSQKEN